VSQFFLGKVYDRGEWEPEDQGPMLESDDQEVTMVDQSIIPRAMTYMVMWIIIRMSSNGVLLVLI